MSIKAMKLALEALAWVEPCDSTQAMENAITALRQAIEQATCKQSLQVQQEPVGKFAKFTDGVWREVTDGSAGVSLYTTAPQRTWVGLNEQDFLAINQSCLTKLQAATSAESILKEKNNG